MPRQRLSGELLLFKSDSVQTAWSGLDKHDGRSPRCTAGPLMRGELQLSVMTR